MLPFRLLEEFLHWRLPISSSLDETPSTLWIELLSTLWIELLSTLWIELLSTLWIELLTTAAVLAGVSRTQETKGQQKWVQGGVPWNTEDPVAEAEWGGAVPSSRTDRPGEHPLTVESNI